MQTWEIWWGRVKLSSRDTPKLWKKAEKGIDELFVEREWVKGGWPKFSWDKSVAV